MSTMSSTDTAETGTKTAESATECMMSALGVLFEGILESDRGHGFESDESIGMWGRVMESGFAALPHRRQRDITIAMEVFLNATGKGDQDLRRDVTALCSASPGPATALSEAVLGVIRDRDGLIAQTDRVCGTVDHPLYRKRTSKSRRISAKTDDRDGPSILHMDRDAFIREYWERFGRMIMTVIHQMRVLGPVSESDMAFALMAGDSVCCVPCSHYSADASMAMAMDMMSPRTFADLTLVRLGAEDDGLDSDALRLVRAGAADDEIHAFTERLLSGMLEPEGHPFMRHPVLADRIISYMNDGIGVSGAFARMVLSTVDVIGPPPSGFIVRGGGGDLLYRVLSRIEVRELSSDEPLSRFLIDDVPVAGADTASLDADATFVARRVLLPMLDWDYNPSPALDDCEWLLSLDFPPMDATNLRAAFRRVLSMVDWSIAEPMTLMSNGRLDYARPYSRRNAATVFIEPVKSALFMHDAGLMRDIVAVYDMISALEGCMHPNDGGSAGDGNEWGADGVRVHMDVVDEAIGYLCDGYPDDFIAERIRAAALPVEPMGLRGSGIHGGFSDKEVLEFRPPTASARHAVSIGMFVIDARELAAAAE